MGNEEGVVISRALAGDVARLSERITGYDMRMISDADIIITFANLKEKAERRNNHKMLKLLDKLEKQFRARQYVTWTRGIMGDLSRLALAYGGDAPDQGLEDLV